MNSQFEHDDHTTQPDFQSILRQRIRDLGFENTMAMFRHHATESLDELALRVAVSPDELRFNFLCEAFGLGENVPHQQVRQYSIELLVRMLWSVPGGWQRRKSGRIGAGTLRQLRTWESSPALKWHGYDVATWSVARKLERRNEIERGWRPEDSADPLLVAIFNEHWHLTDCN